MGKGFAQRQGKRVAEYRQGVSPKSDRVSGARGKTSQRRIMKILIACEESQEVCKAFRKKGHESYSCDIKECTGGHPEWHIKDNVLNHLQGWDMIIASNG